MQYSLTRSETIPFLDSNGQILQMRNFEIAITITSEPNETLEQIEEQLNTTFEKHRQEIAKKIPLLQKYDKWLLAIKEELRKKCTEQEFNRIISQVKLIK